MREERIYPVLPLKDVVLFPDCVAPLIVMRPRSLAALDYALTSDKQIFFTAQRQGNVENPEIEELYEVGTVGEVIQAVRSPDGTAKVLVEGMFVGDLIRIETSERFFQALVQRCEPEVEQGRELQALMRVAHKEFDRYARLSDRIPEELHYSIRGIKDPTSLANALSHYVSFKLEDKQKLLECLNAREKFFRLVRLLQQENEILEIEQCIHEEVKSQIGKNQREYYLSEQLKVIERELGVKEEDAELQETENRLKKIKMSKEAQERVRKELERLKKMPPLSPEATVSKTYIDWLMELPWGIVTRDNLDLKRAQRILDEDHYALERVKERIVEYLAVNKHKGELKGPILCFVGPPGVGKTSLARSIARSLDRNFVRISLGGVRDEAEIRGHRRTYVGALPGKVIQGIKKAASMNPVFLMDEVDKIGVDFRGDPAAALLEVLDPEQNKAFNDHYLEVDFDLSRVMFITTANTTEGIPPALVDRMEALFLPGYTQEEKIQIAERHLIPKQLEAHGLKDPDIEFPEETIKTIIHSYTREAGVRNLERSVATVCRKVVREKVQGRKRARRVISPRMLRKYLGPTRYTAAAVGKRPEVGVALGLAWTETGGEILPAETTVMRGKGDLMLTGMLGEIMQESAKTALSYIRSRAPRLGITEDFYKYYDLHIHLPEGAIPKDGPSAGVTLATSMISALSGQAVRQDVAMTGEITLRGKVLRIGGLKEKVLAAHRAGFRTVVLPRENREELDELPVDIKKELRFILVEHLDDVLKASLKAGSKTRTPGAKKSATSTKRLGVKDKGRDDQPRVRGQ